MSAARQLSRSNGIDQWLSFAAQAASSAIFAILILLEILWVPLTYADDLAACIGQPVQFDGTVPLQYATVNGSSGPRLYLDKSYSDHCSSGAPASCPKVAYLLPGDAVAVGKMCSTRDYVQYIGEKHMSEGWVDSAALSPIAPPPPATPPVTKIGNQILRPPDGRQYHFELTQGKGTPVCEAYQQRLNQTEFYAPPYCGRPESTLVPGFAALQRRYLTTDEYKALYFDAQDVLNNNPLHYEYKRQQNADGSITLVPPRERRYSGFTPGTWTYDPPADIENSDNADYVIMWTPDDRYYSDCGTAGNPNGGVVRGSDAGVVMSAKDKSINRDASYAVFGRSNLESLANYRNSYMEFSTEFGVFRYRGFNYFDAMFNPASYREHRDFVGKDGQKTHDPNLSDTLVVFLYTHHERKDVCEYQVFGLRSRP